MKPIVFSLTKNNTRGIGREIVDTVHGMTQPVKRIVIETPNVVKPQKFINSRLDHVNVMVIKSDHHSATLFVD